MGMFDTVRLVGHTLPDDGDKYREKAWWQTKDFDCQMEEVRIQNGRLVQDRVHYEEVPKAERPHPNDDGLLGMMGSLRTVVDEKDIDMNFHGIMEFHTYISETKESFHYHAKFTDGNLVSIERYRYEG